MQYITHKFEYSKEKPNTLTADGNMLLSCVLKLLEGCLALFFTCLGSVHLDCP